MQIIPEFKNYAKTEAYNHPPSYSMPLTWHLELGQRKIDRSRFPDSWGLWGDHTNNPSWDTPLARQTISQGRPFLVPYAGMFGVTTPNNVPPERVGIDGPAVLPVPSMYPPSDINLIKFKI
jgi:hypothetical protein